MANSLAEDVEAVTIRSRRRGRPTKEEAASLVRLIRKTALELFMTRGFEAVTMDAIAAQIAISKGTLYGRYPNKAELLRSIIQEEIGEWGVRASASAGPMPDNLGDRLRLHARTMIESQGRSEIRSMERLMAEIAGNFPDLAAAFIEVGQRAFLRYLARDIQPFLPVQDGAESRRADTLAMILLQTVTGWHRSQSANRVVEDGEAIQFAEDVISVMLASVDAGRSTIVLAR